jgi:ABC-type Na+ efflux pump, permease component
MSKIGLVTSREYMTRVTKKSFIFTTLLTPIFMLALMALPAIIIAMGGTDTRTVMVVDNTGVIEPALKSDSDVKFVSANAPVDTLLAHNDFDVIMIIPDSAVTADTPLRLYSNGPSSMMLESTITSQVNDRIEELRLKNYNIDNLDKILDEVHSDVKVTLVRTDREDSESASAGLSYGIGIALTFVLYMFLLLYGQMVMTSIIEEKNNRVLEIMVSSIKPTQLMLGKIMGIGLVALTQILLWCVLLIVMSAFILPALLPADMLAQVQQMQAGGLATTAIDSEDMEIVSALAMLGNVGFIVKILVWMTVFLIAGFLFYSAINAAIGSAVDNIQDAGQLQIIIVLPIMIGLVASMVSAADPNSSLAFWLSMIPFTSPMVMMSRIPAGIPDWEVILSLVILIASVFAVIWIAAKIYRVGIFMYGKKPNVREIIRWIQYK